MAREVFRWVGTLLFWIALLAVVLAVMTATSTVSRLPAAGVVALLTGAVTAGAYALGWVSLDRVFAPLWFLAAIAVAVTVGRIQHVVLHRPQPLAASDMIEADDAIRARSLHVLSGGGAALVLFMTLNMLAAVAPRGFDAWDTHDLIRSLAPFPVALLGWLVATSLWSPPVTTGRTGTPAIGTA